MMTSSNGNIFRVTGHLCGEFTGPRWIPRTKASDAGLWCFLLIRVWINGWVNNGETGDLRRYRAHYDVIVMRSNVWDEIIIMLRPCAFDSECPKIYFFKRYISFQIVYQVYASLVYISTCINNDICWSSATIWMNVIQWIGAIPCETLASLVNNHIFVNVSQRKNIHSSPISSYRRGFRPIDMWEVKGKHVILIRSNMWLNLHFG